MTAEVSAPPAQTTSLQERMTFTGGAFGAWRIVRLVAVTGEELKHAPRLHILRDGAPAPRDAVWHLRGVTSYERYVNADEQQRLASVSPPLGRATATCAALIPIRKSATWWALPADRRRAVFEQSSHHIATGMRYLPAVARRLYHSRDLGEAFDFLTWFEYAPDAIPAFEELVGTLRETEEWRYVEREIDIRVER